MLRSAFQGDTKCGSARGAGTGRAAQGTGSGTQVRARRCPGPRKLATRYSTSQTPRSHVFSHQKQ